ncbi:MAG: FAD binding domain-containing protein [Desulfitobacteriaceae bacterium]
MLSFSYKRPKTTAEAVAALQEGGRVMAGGSDLLSLVKQRIEVPKVLVDISEVKELSGIALNGDILTIGAACTLQSLAENEIIHKDFSMLSEAVISVASPQIRNAGTVGGNLCQRPRCWYFRSPLFSCYRKGGDTCFAVTGENQYNSIFGGAACFFVSPSDLAPALVALGANAVVASKQGQRRIPLEEFFVLPLQDYTREIILNPDELLLAVEVPRPTAGTKMTYRKLRERQTFDFALVSVAMSLGTQSVRVVLGGVAPIPWRSVEAEKILQGGAITEERAKQAAEAATKMARPMEGNSFKVAMLQGLIATTALSLAQ